MTDLCSSVFVLRPHPALPPNQFLGRAMYKLFLLMLGDISGLTGDSRYADLAQTLHDQNAALPVTVSDFFPSSSEFGWIRITGLNPDLCNTLEQMVKCLPGHSIDVPGRDDRHDAAWTAQVETALLSYHDWAGQTTYEALIADTWTPPEHHHLTLDFTTPTAVRSVGVVHPFPNPAQVFKLLYERLLKLTDLPLPFQPTVEQVEIFAGFFVEIQDYQLQCVQAPVKQKHTLTAFQGRITYGVLHDNAAFRKRAHTRQTRDGDSHLITLYEDIRQHHTEFACLLNLLAAFAFYSGIGLQTAQGMGMVRRVEQNGY